jgi:hypothetical protein
VGLASASDLVWGLNFWWKKGAVWAIQAVSTYCSYLQYPLLYPQNEYINYFTALLYRKNKNNNKKKSIYPPQIYKLLLN